MATIVEICRIREVKTMKNNAPVKGSRTARTAAKPAGRHAARPQANHSKKSTPAKRASHGRFAFLNRKKAPRRPRKPMNKENLRTLMWLWCFPVGLSKLWRQSCTWRRGVKIGITAAMAAVLVAIFVIPTPSAGTYTTGVQMVSENPEVEVYGPALPSLIVPGYTHESTGSIIVNETANDVHYVYAADGARCYHEYECKFAFASSQRLTVYEAYHLGFEPCGRCNPPVYTPGSQLLEPGTEASDGTEGTEGTEAAPEA